MNVTAVVSTTLATVAYDEAREVAGDWNFASRRSTSTGGVPGISASSPGSVRLPKAATLIKPFGGHFAYQRVSPRGAEKVAAAVPAECGREGE